MLTRKPLLVRRNVFLAKWLSNSIEVSCSSKPPFVIAREKELEKLKAAQKAEAARLLAQQESNTSKVAKRKNLKKEGGEENPEDYVDPETASREKKRLSCQMAKQFNPSSVDNLWYAWWEKSGYFVADSSSSKPPFVIGKEILGRDGYSTPLGQDCEFWVVG